MRVVARACRPRVTPTAYGRATGLPSFRPNQQYRADTPHFQDRRYRRQESKIYDHSIRYQHHDTHELRATTATAVEIADNRRNADETSAASYAASDLSKATPLQDVSTIPSDTHARSQLASRTYARETSIFAGKLPKISCQQPSPTPTSRVDSVVGRTSLRGVNEGSGDHQQLRGIPLTTSAARQGDFHKSTANRFDTCTNHALNTHTQTYLHEILDIAQFEFQVGCCDPLEPSFEWEINGSMCNLNTAMETVKFDIFTVSGEAIGHPGVMSNWSGTHPNAVSFRIWSQATATPRPLGDDLPPWFSNHEIYHAPSPKFDWLLEPIGKHNGTLPDDTITLSTGLYGYRRVNDGSSEAQPSGIGGVFTEDSVMYYETCGSRKQ